MRRRVPASPRASRGAALIVLVVVVLSIITGLLLSQLLEIDPRVESRNRSSRTLAIARDALLGHAGARYCSTSPPPAQLLPCPAADETGTAQATCTAPASGPLPWLSLGLPPERDHEARVPTYTLSSSTGATVTAGQTEDVQTLALALDLAALAARCPAPAPPPQDPPPPPPQDPPPPPPEDPPPPPPQDPPPPPPENPPPPPPPPPPPRNPACQPPANTLMSYVHPSSKNNGCRLSGGTIRAECQTAYNQIQTWACPAECKTAATTFLNPPCINSLNATECDAAIAALIRCGQ
ncbi:hypothetical protein ACFFGH_33325 [Lysobacter korlensis]|uniref:Uncharacterized protein n=1 Tax=Lysobacter korlensis TaxID=553636 RepID=A0ABV6S0G7_9GAMM